MDISKEKVVHLFFNYVIYNGYLYKSYISDQELMSGVEEMKNVVMVYEKTSDQDLTDYFRWYPELFNLESKYNCYLVMKLGASNCEIIRNE